jgi:carboxyl-terminal processing protease
MIFRLIGIKQVSNISLVGVLLLCLFGFSSSSVHAQLLNSSRQSLDCKFAYPIQQAYVSQHANYTELIQALEDRTIEQYMKRLDPSKIYLLESDIKQIKKQLSRLFSKVKSKNCGDLNQVQGLLNNRVRERAEFAKAFLDNKYQFDPSVELELDRDKTPYPKTKEQAEVYLKKYIHFQISNYLMTDTPLDEARENVKKNWDRIVKRIVETKEEELVAGFLDSFGRALDPHTSFMARDNNEDFKIQMSLSLQGIGATLSFQDGFTVIEALVPGGPAAKSGLLEAQDRIISVGQGESDPMENVVEMDLKDVVRKIRGPKGTKVRLTILRRTPEGKNTFNVTLVRDQIKLEDEAASLLTQTRTIKGEKVKLGIINLPSFYNDGKRGGRSASSDLAKVIEQAKKEKVAGLVLDLSTNGGGSLDDAVRIAGLFFKTGNVVKQSTKEDPKGLKNRLADTQADVNWSGPLVILVSRISASASEIVAGALQDYRRAIIVGADHTFGKGTVQTVIDIPPYSGDLGAIKVTVGTFFIPGGYSTQHRGVLSDIVIPGKFDGEDVGEKSLDYSLPPAQLPPFLSPEAYVKEGSDAWKVVDGETIKALALKSKERVQKDPEFKKLQEDLEKAKKNGKILKLSEVMKDKDKDKDKSKDKDKDKDKNKNKDQDKGQDKGQNKEVDQNQKVSEKDGNPKAEGLGVTQGLNKLGQFFGKKNLKNRSKEEKEEDYLKRPELQESLNVLADYIELKP